MKACDASADFPVRAAGSLPLMKFRPVDISLVAVLSGNAHAITPSPSMVSAREQLQVWPAKKVRQEGELGLDKKERKTGLSAVGREIEPYDSPLLPGLYLWILYAALPKLR